MFLNFGALNTKIEFIIIIKINYYLKQLYGSVDLSRLKIENFESISALFACIHH